MKTESIEQIIDYLNNQGIKARYEESRSTDFNRIIEFEIENETYYIEWWVNQSYLKFKNAFSVPYFPFKYIVVNNYSPTTEHKYQLCFYDEEVKKDKDSIFYNPIPFGCMRFPFNK